MKRLRTAVWVASWAFLVAPLQAQNPRPGGAPPAPGAVSGKVVDAESAAPISAATVEVWRKEDNKLVTGAIASQDGTFRIEGLRAGTYRLKVVMIGYANAVTPDLAISEESPRANVGAIKMTREAIELTGIEVTAEKPAIIAPDRNAYRVKDVAPAATSTSEVLDNVPSVSVDADGKVSLRGNENVVVQINGRPTPMTGMQLAGYLKQLPANTVERVEVIPNPSAKQDPEGMAGIINIVMKQGVDLGTSGGLNTTQSTVDRYSIGANIGHQEGKLAFYASYGYNHDARTELGVNNRTRLGSSGSPLSYTLQDVDGENVDKGHNLTLNADYGFDKQDVLSTSFNLNRREGGNGSTILFEELSGTQQSLDTYDRLRDQGVTSWLGDGALSFKRTLEPQKHEISAELRYNRSTDDDVTQLWREPLQTDTRSELENDDISTTTDNVTGQLDYTDMLGEKVKIETGVKVTNRSLARDYVVTKDVDGSGQWLPSDLSNALQFSENVNAAYAVLSHSGTRLDLQGGLRAEYAHRNFTLEETAQSYVHDYTSLFPSALINYKLNDKTQAKLSYSRRVRRPGTQELNPFPMFFDVQNVFIGNPQLDPEYTDAIELGYQRSGQLGTLQISPFYRRTSNIIRVGINTADTVDAREVTTIRFKNLDHGSSWGTDVNGQFKLGKAVSGLAAFDIFKMVTDGGSTSTLSSDAVNWMARANANFNVGPATTLMLMYFYRGAMNAEGYSFSPMQMANVSVRQRLMDDKVTAVLRIADPFNQMKFRVNVAGEDIEQLTTRRFNTRGVFLSLQYNFGKPPRLRQRKQDDQPASASPFGPG